MDQFEEHMEAGGVTWNRGTMAHRVLDDAGKDLLFRCARSHSAWSDEGVSDDVLRELYDLTKWGPTSVNCNPARILFLRTPEAKQRLLPALASGNVQKTLAAPVTAIIGYDVKFYELLPELFPHVEVRSGFADKPELAELVAIRNGSLQGAYFIIAARALGLDCGPMSGFDHAIVDREFFPRGGPPGSVQPAPFQKMNIKSNFLCNLGYGDATKHPPRGPRLDFQRACRLL